MITPGMRKSRAFADNELIGIKGLFFLCLWTEKLSKDLHEN